MSKEIVDLDETVITRRFTHELVMENGVLMEYVDGFWIDEAGQRHEQHDKRPLE